ncbi:MAG TPA: hypothetical protein VEV16_11655 [Daejeonella sp.]|nr:hypothetical protein [Daejeonella sp.]
MNKKSRIFIALSVVLMLSAYFLPLWQIVLEAPQYPEGLGLKIWLNGITGNVDQINGLNHYIGMKHIVPGDFIEFKILPYIFGAVLLVGLLVSLTGSKIMLKVWFIVLLLFAIVGFTDFYLWEYEYGHNLDPTAAIKVPGMTYQPPLVGYKQLLNFVAGSLPDIGGVFVGLGGMISGTVFYYEKFLKRVK